MSNYLISKMQGVRHRAPGVHYRVSGVRCQRYYWTAPEYENEDEDEDEDEDE